MTQTEQDRARLSQLLADYQGAQLPEPFTALREEFLAQAAGFRAIAKERFAALEAKIIEAISPFVTPKEAQWDTSFDLRGHVMIIAQQLPAWRESHTLAETCQDITPQTAAQVIEEFISTREAFAAMPAI